MTNAVLQCTVLKWAPAFYWCCKIPFVFFDRHSLFTSGFYWFCVSLRFSCQSFRTSVFVPRSLASKLQDHCYKQLFFWEGFNAWSGILVARHGLFCHMCCANSLWPKLIYNQSFLCGEPWKNNDKKRASVAYHVSTLKCRVSCVFLHFLHLITFGMACFNHFLYDARSF
jgi:hypothetical protein